jgi:hypothetical protein
MRVAIAARAIATVVAVMAAGGCAAVDTGPGGAWTACGNMARITAMQVRRDPLWAPLPSAHPSVAAVRRLFHDFCVIAGHPDDGGLAPGSYSAAETTPLYRGVFYAGDKQLATFSYESGYLGLYVGPAQVQTSIAGSAAAAASVDTDFAAALGLSPEAAYNPPRQPPPRLPPPRLMVTRTAAVMGRPSWTAVISGTTRCSGGEQATLGINIYETSASGQSGGIKMTMACDGRQHDWNAAVRVSLPTGPQGTYWTAPGYGSVTLFLYDLGGPLDFYTGPLARPFSRGIRFVAGRQASRRPTVGDKAHLDTVTERGRAHHREIHRVPAAADIEVFIIITTTTQLCERAGQTIE